MSEATMMQEKIKAIVCGTEYTTNEQRTRYIVGWIATVFAIVTILFMLWWAPEQANKNAARILLVIWAVLPPIWFWYDYFILYAQEVKNTNSLSRISRSLSTGKSLVEIFGWPSSLLAGLYFQSVTARIETPNNYLRLGLGSCLNLA